jgi:choline dehydrogenase
MPSAQEPTEVFDYIVVGAGSSGSAVAARLSANGEASVLLLEAGLRDRKPAVHIPAAFSQLFRSDRDWNYDTIPQPELGDRRIYWPRGKMLGGSSSLNAMMWVRGFAADYDKWAEAARPTWSWSSLLPYFRQVERVAGTHRSDEGSSGAISISAQRQPRSHTAAFLEAVTQLGMSVERANSAEPGGFAQTMVSQRRGARFSAADAYLKPARTRANLTVRVDAQAGRVLFDGKDAVGIEYFVGRERRRVTARREVVLCGGAVNTPQLLMLSGIGDGAALSELGIKMVKNSPEVGKNLVDHLIAGLVVEANGDTLYSAQRPAELARYLLRRKGMLTSNGGGLRVCSHPFRIAAAGHRNPFRARGLRRAGPRTPAYARVDHRRDLAAAGEFRSDHARGRRSDGAAVNRSAVSVGPGRPRSGDPVGRAGRV